MRIPRKSIQVFTVSALASFVFVPANGQKNPDHAPRRLAVSEASHQVHLKLADGRIVTVDEAWESEQGIWCRQGGMNHLIARERVKAIERGARSNPKPNLQQVDGRVNDDKNNHADGSNRSDGQPVWIYLVGGARVEADSATESGEGVWYRRGALTIFIERARIDHVELEPLETLVESNSKFNKERGWTTGNKGLDVLIRQSGLKYGVDPYLIFCVMEQESHFNARALSPKGARGLMQLMPATAARFGVKRSGDPAQNIAGGTRYLKQLIGQFDGRIDLVLASYNAGEGAVLKFGRNVPPYRETRDYVKKISYRYRGSRSTVFSKGELNGSSIRAGT
jgi:Zn-finger nucleic acid-binding protein